MAGDNLYPFTTTEREDPDFLTKTELASIVHKCIGIGYEVLTQVQLILYYHEQYSAEVDEGVVKFCKEWSKAFKKMADSLRLL